MQRAHEDRGAGRGGQDGRDGVGAEHAGAPQHGAVEQRVRRARLDPRERDSSAAAAANAPSVGMRDRAVALDQREGQHERREARRGQQRAGDVERRRVRGAPLGEACAAPEARRPGRSAR